MTADVTILTTVVSTEPIYVDFDVDEQSLLDYRMRMRQGEVEGAREGSISVGLALANEVGYPHQGVINFVDNRTDPSTGNTRVRATFDNQQGILSPGLFARVQVPFTAKYNAVLVPTEALGMDQQGQYVMVVEDDQVSRRSVTPGSIHDGLTVIRQGLALDEMVVTSGLQKIRPGSHVKIAVQQ